MDDKIEEYGIPGLILVVMLALCLFDCYDRYQNIGSMYIVYFVMLYGLSAALSAFGEENDVNVKSRIWYPGVLVIGVILFFVQCIFSFPVIENIAVVLSFVLTFLAAMYWHESNTGNVTPFRQNVNRVINILTVPMVMLYVNPWAHEQQLIALYLVYILLRVVLSYMSRKKLV